jgi:hypothetical protein
MNPRAAVIVTALFLASTACRGGGPTAAPSVTEGAAATTRPPSSASSGDCENPYLPVVEGATYNRKSTSSLGDSTQTSTIKDVRPNGFSVERTGVLSSGKPYTYLENWSCTPQGLVQAPTDELAAIATGANATVTVETVSNDGVTLPKDVKAGDTWTETFTVNVIGPNSTSPWTVQYEFEAIGTESVTVPAGAFTALHLTNQITWVNGAVPPMKVDYWFAPEVGLVKSGYTMEGLGSGTTELITYTIP